MTIDRYAKIESVWQKAEEFLESFEEEGETGVFFHRVPHALSDEAEIGQTVSLIIRFLDREAPGFHVHARVLEKCVEPESMGLRLSFLVEERNRQELVVACARGERVPLRHRRSKRTPCDLRVRASAGGTRFDARATDISAGGTHLSIDDTLPQEGTELKLAVAFPGRRKPLHLRGRVASVVHGGPQRGVGIEFLFESATQRDTLADHVQSLLSRAES